MPSRKRAEGQARQAKAKAVTSPTSNKTYEYFELPSLRSWSEFHPSRRKKIQELYNLAKTHLANGNYDDAFVANVNGFQYLDVVERDFAAFPFVHGTVVCANKRALESGIPMSSGTRSSLISMLYDSIDQNPTSDSARIGSSAIQILLFESMRLDFKDMDLVELDSLLEIVQEIERFAALAIHTSLSDEKKQKCLDRVDKARKLYTERVKLITEHTHSDDLSDIKSNVKRLRQSDLDSLGPGELMTDIIVHNGMDTASKLEDGSTMTIVVDP